MALSVAVYLWILVPLTVFGALAVSIAFAGRRFNTTVFRSPVAPPKSHQGLFVNVVVDPADRSGAASSSK